MKSASGSHKHLSFHRLSGAFFSDEAVRHEVTDFLLFALIAALLLANRIDGHGGCSRDRLSDVSGKSEPGLL